MKKQKLYTKKLITPVGLLLAMATDNAICLLEFMHNDHWLLSKSQVMQYLNGTDNQKDTPLLLQLEEQLKAYFAKELQSFSLPLVLSGTPFQKEVWNYLLTIPYGETRSYKQQAEAIDKPQSFRAVANANGKNHVSILIPCHRVISSDGSLAGYGGGITRKEFLLNLEKN